MVCTGLKTAFRCEISVERKASRQFRVENGHQDVGGFGCCDEIIDTEQDIDSFSRLENFGSANECERHRFG